VVSKGLILICGGELRSTLQSDVVRLVHSRVALGGGHTPFSPSNPGLGEIDNPPTVVQTLDGAKVRAWLPVAALSHDDEIELDEQRAVKTTPSGEVVARVWLPVSHAVVRRRRR
jgi:hypothetical protein